MVNNVNRYSALFQTNEKPKTHYNGLLSNCNWLESYKGPGTRPQFSESDEKAVRNVRRKLY